MSARLALVARHRPALVLLAVFYPVIGALVARSLLTVALCTMLVVSVAVQLTVVLRRAQPSASTS